PFSHRGRCSYSQIGVLPHQNRESPRTVGAPAPGAKVSWLDSLFAPRAVLLKPNRGPPHQNWDSPRTVGAPAPGAKVSWLDTLFAPRAVLLQPNRGSSYIKTGVFLEP